MRHNNVIEGYNCAILRFHESVAEAIQSINMSCFVVAVYETTHVQLQAYFGNFACLTRNVDARGIN